MRLSGAIKWAGRWVFISATLAGEPVGSSTIDGDWLVRYAPIDLGIIDPKRHRLIRFVAARSGHHQANTPRTLLPM